MRGENRASGVGRRNDAKRRARAARRASLREYVIERANGWCEWYAGSTVHRGEHMAHVYGTGMGGRASADEPGNVAWLCRWHHDVLDGRATVDWETYEATRFGWLSEETKVRTDLARALAAHVAEIRRDRGEAAP